MRCVLSRNVILVIALVAAAGCVRAADAFERAATYAEAAQSKAMQMVAKAEQDLATAKSDVSMVGAVLVDVRLSGDQAALSIANEALVQARAHELEATQFLARARVNLSQRSRSLQDIQQLRRDTTGRPSGVAISDDGAVRQIWRGSVIKTGSGQSTQLFVAGGEAELQLGPDTSYKVTDDDLPRGFIGSLEYGAMRMRSLIQAKLGRKFEVRTPAAVCGVRGTEFLVTTTGAGSTVVVFSGVVAVSRPDGQGGPVLLTAGKKLQVPMTGAWPSVSNIDVSEQTIPWLTERDHAK